MSLPGGRPAAAEARFLFTSDLFDLVDATSGSEKVTNGIVSRAVTSWLSESEHARQVALLVWLSKKLEQWPRFADAKADAPPVHVLDAIARAHSVIVGRETTNAVTTHGLVTTQLPPAMALELQTAGEVWTSAVFCSWCKLCIGQIAPKDSFSYYQR